MVPLGLRVGGADLTALWIRHVMMLEPRTVNPALQLHEPVGFRVQQTCTMALPSTKASSSAITTSRPIPISSSIHRNDIHLASSVIVVVHPNLHFAAK